MSKTEKLNSQGSDGEIGVMKNSEEIDNTGSGYADFMDEGYYTGVTTGAEKNTRSGYEYIDVIVNVDMEVPDEKDYDEVELSFGLPVPDKLKQEGIIPENNMLADFLKEVGRWNNNEVLKLDHFIGHKLKFLCQPKETEKGTYMSIARKVDKKFKIKKV